ncbi:unnamed protein product, partial [Didymodactylos carnosus]
RIYYDITRSDGTIHTVKKCGWTGSCKWGFAGGLGFRACTTYTVPSSHIALNVTMQFLTPTAWYSFWDWTWNDLIIKQYIRYNSSHPLCVCYETFGIVYNARAQKVHCEDVPCARSI